MIATLNAPHVGFITYKETPNRLSLYRLSLSHLREFARLAFKADVTKKTREQEYVKPRQMIHTIAIKENIWGLADIGFHIGRKHHATVLHSQKIVAELCETNYRYREEFEQLVRDWRMFKQKKRLVKFDSRNRIVQEKLFE